MTPQRLQQIREFMYAHGPRNCWTGNLGTACGYIQELLKELNRERLKQKVKGGTLSQADNMESAVGRDA
jgi:hypothetical protein